MALEVGSRLGHYDVTALIGEGGMGQVYQTTDTKLNRQAPSKPMKSLQDSAIREDIGVKPIPSWNSSRLLIAYAAFFFNVVVSIFSCRFNASRSLGRCR